MVATISADLVRSTSLSTQDMMKLRSKLGDLFEDFEKEYPGFWARIVRGDSIECFVPEYRYSLRIAILIKLFVKVLAAEMAKPSIFPEGTLTKSAEKIIFTLHSRWTGPRCL